MATRRFEDPAAFRQAIEERLRQAAMARGVAVNALRLKLLIERLLARLFASPHPPWLLKGGYAMELRFRPRARTTKDLDLACDSDAADERPSRRIESVRELLQEAAARDLGDHLVFRIGEAGRLIEAGLRDREALIAALRQAFAHGRHPLPAAMPAPPPAWRQDFAVLAEEVELPERDVEAAFARLASFWRATGLGAA